MYSILLEIHSIVRYIVMALLILTIIVSLYSLIKKMPYLIFHRITLSSLTSLAHLQFVAGLILYFISPWVVFGNQTMKNEMFRYWTVEHILIMLLAIIFISIPGLSVKRLSDTQRKHKRSFIWTSIALLLILVSLYISQRGIL